MGNDLAMRAQPTPNSLIVKSNALARAAYTASPEVQRILAYAFAVLCERPDSPSGTVVVDNSDLIVEVPVRELGTIFTSMAKSKTMYERVREKRKELTGFAVDMEDEVAGQKKWERWVVVITAAYENGVLKLTFNPQMREHIGILKRNFLAYRMMNIIELDGPCDVQLYDLLHSYLHLGRWRVDYDDLRQRLKIDKKPRFDLVGTFKRDVLAPFLASVNEKTDISVSVEDIKSGRKITGFVFYIQNKQKQLIAEMTDSQKRVLAELKTLGVSAVSAQKVVFNFDVPYIEEKMEAARRAKAAGRIRTNVAGWLMRAITENYNTLTDDEKAAFDKRRRIEYAIDVFERAPESIRRPMLADFKTLMMGSPAQLRLYNEKGLGDPLIRKSFAGFVRSKGNDYGLSLVEGE